MLSPTAMKNKHSQSSSGWLYHAKQIGKGTLLLGTGVLGYLGLSSFFGNKQKYLDNEVKTLNKRNMNSDNYLTSDKTNFAFSKIAHVSPLLTSLSTARTLLSLSETEDKNNGNSHDRFTNTEATNQISLPQLRRSTNSIEGIYQDGQEFQINTYTTSDQRTRNAGSVAALKNGGFVVVWVSNGQDGDNLGVYSQIYNATGYRMGSEFRVNSYTTLRQEFPAVSGIDAGGFVVTWQGEGRGESAGFFNVYGKRYDASGSDLSGEFQINLVNNANQQKGPRPTGLIGGGYVVVWEDNSYPGDVDWGAVGQRYNAAGSRISPFEFHVNTYTTGPQNFPNSAALNDGGFIVIWIDNARDGDGYGVYGQRYDSSANQIGSEFQVNTFTTGAQIPPIISSLTGGGFVVAWKSQIQDPGGNSGIYAQCYNGTASKMGSEFRVNTYTTSVQDDPTVSGLSNGGFVAIWMSIGQDGDQAGIFGQRFNSTCHKFGNEFQVNTYTTNIQTSPSVAGLKNGGFVVVWQSNGQDGANEGVYGRISLPRFVNNELTLTEGDTVVVTPSMLSASTLGIPDSSITFTISNAQQGYFEKTTNPGVVVTTFTQQAVSNNNVRFVHDGSHTAPSYAVKVSDGELETTPSAPLISFTPVNDIPRILNNQLALFQGETVVITSEMLSAMDEETDDSTLTFTINALQHGTFKMTNADILTFNQQKITDGEIRFVHDGSRQPPYYEVKISDGTLESSYFPANITYNLEPIPVRRLTPAELTVIISSGIGGGALFVLCLGTIIGMGAFCLSSQGKLCRKKMQKQRLRKTIKVETELGKVDEEIQGLKIEGSVQKEVKILIEALQANKDVLLNKGREAAYYEQFIEQADHINTNTTQLNTASSNKLTHCLYQAQVELGKIYEEQRNSEKAIKHLKEALKINPEALEVPLLLTKIYTRAKKVSEATKQVEDLANKMEFRINKIEKNLKSDTKTGLTAELKENLNQSEAKDHFKILLQKVREKQALPDLNIVTIQTGSNEKLRQEMVKMGNIIKILKKDHGENEILRAKLNKLSQKQSYLETDYLQKQRVLHQQKYTTRYPELLAFYRRLQLKMTELFLACKVINSGMVDRKDDKINKGLEKTGAVATKLIELGGDVLSFIPGVGLASSILKNTVTVGEKIVEIAYNKHEKLMIRQMSALTVNLGEMDKLVETVARQLTLRYEAQIRCLTTAHKKTGLKKIIAKIKISDDIKNGGAEKLAECAVGRMIDGMRAGVIQFDVKKSLSQQLLKVVFDSKLKQGKFFNNMKVKVKPESGLEGWKDHGIFQGSGLKHRNKNGSYDYYKGEYQCSRPDKYSYRLGDADDIKVLGLKKQNAPTQSPVDKIVTSTYKQPSDRELMPITVKLSSNRNILSNQNKIMQQKNQKGQDTTSLLSLSA